MAEARKLLQQIGHNVQRLPSALAFEHIARDDTALGTKPCVSTSRRTSPRSFWHRVLAHLHAEQVTPQCIICRLQHAAIAIAIKGRARTAQSLTGLGDAALRVGCQLLGQRQLPRIVARRATRSPFLASACTRKRPFSGTGAWLALRQAYPRAAKWMLITHDRAALPVE